MPIKTVYENQEYLMFKYLPNTDKSWVLNRMV